MKTMQQQIVLAPLFALFVGCGIQDGRDVEYYETGQLKSEIRYKNGKKDGLAIYWREDGTKLIKWNYTAGKLEGVSTSWYQNGQKSSEIHYKNGEKDGLDTKWREDGKKTNEWTFKDGEFISGKNFE